MIKDSVIFKECAHLLISSILQPHLPFDRRSKGVLLATTTILVLQACFILLRYTIHQSAWNMTVTCVILVMYHLRVKCYHCHKTIRASKNMWIELNYCSIILPLFKPRRTVSVLNQFPWRNPHVIRTTTIQNPSKFRQDKSCELRIRLVELRVKWTNASPLLVR